MDFAVENLGHRDFQTGFGWSPGQEAWKYNLPMLTTLCCTEEPKQVLNKCLNIHKYVHLWALPEETVLYLCFRKFDRICN